MRFAAVAVFVLAGCGAITGVDFDRVSERREPDAGDPSAGGEPRKNGTMRPVGADGDGMHTPGTEPGASIPPGSHPGPNPAAPDAGSPATPADGGAMNPFPDAATPACTGPTLYVAVGAGLSNYHARVLRLGLDGQQKCAPLRLADMLPEYPHGLAFLPPGTLALTDTTSVWFINDDDRIAAVGYSVEDHSPSIAISFLFPLVDAAGTTHTALGVDNRGSSTLDVSSIQVVDSGRMASAWGVGAGASDLVFARSSYFPVARQDPFDPHKIAMITLGSDASEVCHLAEVLAPFDNAAHATSCYLPTVAANAFVKGMNTLAQGANARFVWITRDSEFGSGPDSAWTLDVPIAHHALPPPAPLGPLACAPSVCPAPLTLDDAVPDPAGAGSVLAICHGNDAQGNATPGRVVRMSTAGCAVVFDGNTALLPVETVTNIAVRP
jgi:hypothetical protein